MRSAVLTPGSLEGSSIPFLYGERMTFMISLSIFYLFHRCTLKIPVFSSRFSLGADLLSVSITLLSFWVTLCTPAAYLSSHPLF